MKIQPTYSNNQGFSLIELLIAATILTTAAILLALVAPGMIQKNKTNLAARDLTDALSYAQSQSITATDQLTYGVSIDPTSNPVSFTIISVTDTGSTQTQQQKNLPSTVNITNPTSIQTIVFRKRSGTPTLNGIALSSPFEIQIDTPRYETTTIINPNGAITNTPVTYK